jgi:hypothetical protein
MGKIKKVKPCYLETTTSTVDTRKYFRVTNDGVLVIDLEKNSIKPAKSIASSPNEIIPSSEFLFEKARDRVVNYLKEL